jgi:hypothetical protein
MQYRQDKEDHDDDDDDDDVSYDARSNLQENLCITSTFDNFVQTDDALTPCRKLDLN